MAQIVATKAHADRCNLKAISSGGSKADTILSKGEIWLVDTTNADKGSEGWGKYDAYIVGDGVNKASALEVEYIDNLSSKQDVLYWDTTPRLDSKNPVYSSGIRAALNEKANNTDVYTKAEVNNMIVSNPITIEIVDVLPTNPKTNTIYRLTGTTNYSDYMYNGTSLVLLATYDNALDDVPTVNSDNIVKSRGIYDESIDIRKMLAVDEGETVAYFGGNTILTSVVIKLNEDTGLYEIAKASNSNYRTYYINNLIPKGTLLHFTAYTSQSRTSVIAYMTTDPSMYESLIGENVSIINKQVVDGDWDLWLVMPEDGYLVVYYYTQYWSDRLLRLYPVKEVVEQKDLDILEAGVDTLEANVDKLITTTEDYPDTKVDIYGGTHYVTLDGMEIATSTGHYINPYCWGWFL